VRKELHNRSRRGVAQELWSLGLVYNLIRRLEMEQIASEAGVAPRRISA